MIMFCDGPLTVCFMNVMYLRRRERYSSHDRSCIPWINTDAALWARIHQESWDWLYLVTGMNRLSHQGEPIIQLGSQAIRSRSSIRYARSMVSLTEEGEACSLPQQCSAAVDRLFRPQVSAHL